MLGYWESPGSKPNFCQSFSICHWNLKYGLLQTYISIYSFNVTCLSDTYLDSNIIPDDENLQIPGYNLFRADHL